MPQSVGMHSGRIFYSGALLCAAYLLSACRGSSTAQRAPPLELEGLSPITDDTYLYEFPVWSPDGRYIAVTRNMNNQSKLGPDLQGWEVVLVDSSTGDVTRIHGPDWQSVPTWSASGDQLAYVVSGPDEASDGGAQSDQIAIYSVSGGTEKRIQCECSNPIWLPEGRIRVDVAVRQGSDTPWQAASASLDPLTGTFDEPMPYAGMPNLEVALQDGTSLRMHGPYLVLGEANAILMTAYDHGCRGVWIYRTGSNGPEPLIDSPEVDECDPALSADGSQLLYTVKPPGSFAPTTIMIAGSDGSSPVVFLEPGGDPFQARHPTWSPDGTRIAFVYGVFHETAPAYSTLYLADFPPQLQLP